MTAGVINLTNSRLQPFLHELDHAIEDNLTRSRQQFLNEATNRLSHVIRLVASCQDYMQQCSVAQTTG